MTVSPIVGTESTDDLFLAYALAARAHASGTEDGNSVLANEQFDRIVQIYRELKRRDARSCLIAPLNSPDRGVQLWAATHSLPIVPDAAVAILERIAQATPGLLVFSASMVLKAWSEGTFVVPE